MNDMRTKLLLILFLCLPFGMSAGNSADNGYDDIDGFFEYCSKINSPDIQAYDEQDSESAYRGY